MGIDGWQRLTVHGSPEAVKEISEVYKTLPCMDYAKLKYPHSRRIDISYSFRNTDIYMYLEELLTKYPKCLFINELTTEHGDSETWIARFVSGKLHKDMYWYCESTFDVKFYWMDKQYPRNQFTDESYKECDCHYNTDMLINKTSHYCCRKRKYNYDITKPLNHKANFIGDEHEIKEIMRLFSERGVLLKEYNRDYDDNRCLLYSSGEFRTLGKDPYRFLERLCLKFPHCWIASCFKDDLGNKCIWENGVVCQSKEVSKYDEYHLDDFQIYQN